MAILKPTAAMTPTWTFFEGEWQPGNVAIMGSRTHAAWLGSMVFDGARAFEGVTPDLDLHCQRVNASAASFFLQPVVSVDRWIELAHDGIKRFAPNTELYIRPMYWAEDGAAGGGVRFDPVTTRWCLCIYEAALPVPTGSAITLSPYRRPTRESAPVEAKAGCLYPNNSHALIEAYRRGFGNCLLRDMLGNIAELANSNVFLAKDGVVYTPAANGTFLSGITRNRVIGLLAKAGVHVVETVLRYNDFETADEIFSTGNFLKVAPITRIDERKLEPGPFYKLARGLYWDFAHGAARQD
ncbi:MAG: branched-chain amino acid aminotransferase [Beijerinckiaceae bacterium]|nr:branched-chain amino acid aminotransferase [Beijerinckiaceae bacterium]